MCVPTMSNHMRKASITNIRDSQEVVPIVNHSIQHIPNPQYTYYYAVSGLCRCVAPARVCAGFVPRLRGRETDSERDALCQSRVDFVLTDLSERNHAMSRASGAVVQPDARSNADADAGPARGAGTRAAAWFGQRIESFTCEYVLVVSRSQICAYNTYIRSYEYEYSEGLSLAASECLNSVQGLTKLQFGPPTEWEIFNVLCKGDCRAYNDRVQRVLTASDCRCRRVLNARYQCPTTPTDMLCSEVQFCYDYDTYMRDYCLESSCGRWQTNENDWRTARAQCSAAASAPSLLAAVVAGVVAALNLRAGPR